MLSVSDLHLDEVVNCGSVVSVRSARRTFTPEYTTPKSSVADADTKTTSLGGCQGTVSRSASPRTLRRTTHVLAGADAVLACSSDCRLSHAQAAPITGRANW